MSNFDNVDEVKDNTVYNLNVESVTCKNLRNFKSLFHFSLVSLSNFSVFDNFFVLVNANKTLRMDVLIAFNKDFRNYKDVILIHVLDRRYLSKSK